MKDREYLRAFRTIVSLAALILIGIGVGVAGAATGTCDWQRDGPHKMHWAQTPDEGYTGVDVNIERLTLADDFKCTATGPIRDIHLWGSFLDEVLPKGGADSLTFELAIWSDPIVTDPGGRGATAPLWVRTFRPGEYAVTKIHNGPQSWYDPISRLYLPANHRDTYQYNFCIDRDPFIQEEGRVYWLAVKDLSAGGNYTFGWKSTARQYRWNSDARYIASANAYWTEITYPKGHDYAEQTLDFAFTITDGAQMFPERDLGDAPDSSCSVAGATMTAYAGVAAHFPTVYQAGSPPYGPIHLYPRDMYFLGKWVSFEIEADVGLDEDGVNNLEPAKDVANQDGADDGLRLPIYMPFCDRTTVEYTVTVTSAAAREAYVNVWCDWNRDGDWDDTMTCADGSRVPEWAVQNDRPVFTGVGTYTFTSSAFKCWHADKEGTDPMWVRISIAEQRYSPAVVALGAAPGVEGAGPAAGYKYGETEDYYIRPIAEPPTVKYDWGDAPETAAAPGYPTVAASDGALHVLAGPWLGDANDAPDPESDGQPDLNALGDDSHDSDDENGVSIAPLTRGQDADATVEVNGGGGVVQAWIDFNADRAWQASEKVFDDFLPDGVHVFSFSVPNSAVLGQTFARVRISRQGGLEPTGAAPDGEVEDLPVRIVAPPDPKSWCQRPDTTPHGIDIQVDRSNDLQRVVADDFGCTSAGALTHVRLWGSWRDDRKGEIKKLRLRVHPDDPVGLEGADKKNLYSKPGPEVLWEKEFLAGQFTETLYHVVHIAGEWWCDPPANVALPGADAQIWQIDIDMHSGASFVQDGTPDKPRIYWLAVETETVEGQFGWKTRRWPDHFMDDAVWATGTLLPPPWREMFYPHGHRYYDVERNSIDMAFCLLFEGGGVPATSQPVAVTQCPPVETTCPALLTECPVVETRCPTGETYCPVVQTRCPPVTTRCPATVTECQVVPTQCPPTATECQVVQTQCPIVETRCPTTDTKCPPLSTACPVVFTQCPPTPTECEVAQTQCPIVETRCPATETKCPPLASACPTVYTQCPPTVTECQQVQTQCPATPTQCQQVETQCPAVPTECPAIPTQCPVVRTQCPPTKTECQQMPTECPVVWTQCPPTQTECQQVRTACPTVPTECPTVPTQCPVVVSQCPPSPTQCPVPTICPIVPTQCGSPTTQCPIPGTACLLSTASDGNGGRLLPVSSCPMVEADCPTVSEYLLLAKEVGK